MNVNITLLGELITFAILVWVTMHYIWPPIQKAMQEREAKIADGLAAAEKSKKNLELSAKKVTEQLRAAKNDAAKIIDHANQRSGQIIEDAKTVANKEGKRLLELAKSDIATEKESAKQQLRQQVAALAVDAAEKVLRSNVDAKANQQLIDKVIAEL